MSCKTPDEMKNGGKALVLNIARPRESKEPGLAAATEKYVARLIAAQAEERILGDKDMKSRSKPC